MNQGDMKILCRRDIVRIWNRLSFACEACPGLVDNAADLSLRN